MKAIAATSAKILLIAVTFFALGPQVGSLDIDGDGVPDVPIIVILQPSSALSILTLNNNQRKGPILATGSTLGVVMRGDLGRPIAREFRLHLSDSVRRRVVSSLRC